MSCRDVPRACWDWHQRRRGEQRMDMHMEVCWNPLRCGLHMCICELLPPSTDVMRFLLCQRAMRGRSVSMETMSRSGANLPTSLSGGGLAHISAEVTLLCTSMTLFLLLYFWMLLNRVHACCVFYSSNQFLVFQGSIMKRNGCKLLSSLWNNATVLHAWCWSIHTF